MRRSLLGTRHAGHALWCLALFACQHAAPPSGAKATPAPGPTPLPSFDPDAPLELASLAGNTETYSFAVGRCHGEPPALECELSARIMRAGRLIFSLPLPLCWSDQVARVPAASVPGLGDPLGAPAGWLAFSIGQNESQQLFGAHLLRLAPRREGLLLRTVHDGAAHDVLLLRENDALRSVELEGRWTALAVHAKDRESDELVQFSQVSGEAGFVWARSLRWDSGAESLRVDRDPAAFLVGAGLYQSYAAAEVARAKACLPNAVVAETDAYAGLPPSFYFVGALSGEQRLASAAVAAAEECAQPTPPARMVPLRLRGAMLARMPLGSADQAALIGVGGYNGSGWPLLVSSATAQQAKPAVEVSWPLGSPVGHAATPVDLPSDDPPEPLRGAVSWSFGVEQTMSVVALGTVRLTAGQRALLISQEAGFEHRKRRHDLVVRDNAGLRLAWSVEDPPGPAWSDVVVRTKPDHSDELLLFSNFESTQAGEVDRLQISRLVWDGRKGELESTPAGCDSGVYLAIFGVFPTLAKAIAAKREACNVSDTFPPQPLVLPAPLRSGLKGYVLAVASPDAAHARDALAEATACWPEARTALVPWCPRDKK